MVNQQLTAKEILERTGIQWYQLENMIRSKQVTALTSYGKGVPRKFSFSAIDEINNILKKRGVENEN